MRKTILEGCETQGPTTERPGNCHVGFQYFDTTIDMALVWTGSAWRPASVAYGTTDTRPSAADVPPGGQFYNDTSGALEVSDGAVWLSLVPADEQSSSDSTSSSSTESTSSVGSSSASSESSSSESTSSSSQSQ